MKKALEFAEEAARKIAQEAGSEEIVKVSCRAASPHSPIDRFTLSKIPYLSESPYRKLFRWEVDGSNPHSLLFALSRLKMEGAVKRGASIAGEKSPLYPFRPLWIECDRSVAIGERAGVALPAYFLGSGTNILDKVCRSLLEHGFNTLICGSRGCSFSEKPSVEEQEVEAIIRRFDEYGIKFVAKPLICLPKGEKPLYLAPTDPPFRLHLQEALCDLQRALPSLKWFFWQSLYLEEDFHRHPSGRMSTKLEKCVIELKLLEEALCGGNKLIYYLPASDAAMAKRQMQWIQRLLREFSPKSSFAFSLLAGDVKEEGKPPHPLLEELPSTRKASSAPLLAIANSGALGSGDGYWPNFPVNLYDEYLPLAARGRVDGLIHLIRNIPKAGSFAHALLWAAGEAMWEPLSARELLQRWHARYFGDGDFPLFFSLIKKAREVALALGGLEREQGDLSDQQLLRCRMESALAALKEVEAIAKQGGKFHSYSKGALRDSFLLFIKDARRIILHLSRKSNLSLQQIDSAECQGAGLFTKYQSGGVGIGAQSAGKVEMLKAPLIGDEGSPSHKVYWEANIDA